MQLAPELQILILNAAILGVAYLGIYPTLRDKTMPRLLTVDLTLSVVAVGVAGALFWGRGVSFDMLLFSTNWAVFSIVTLMLMEAPLFYLFARKHGISLTGED